MRLPSPADKLLEITVMGIAGAVVCAAALPFVPLPQPEAWTFLAISVLLHTLYFAALAAAYHWGDLSAYRIVLWAMTRAPIAAVAALREASVSFAALIGAVFLREGYGPVRVAGAALVVCGIGLLGL